MDSLHSSVHSIEALVATVQESQRMLAQYKNYQNINKNLNYDDGQVTERVVNQVFHHDTQNGIQTTEKMYFNISGSMKPISITTAS